VFIDMMDSDDLAAARNAAAALEDGRAAFFHDPEHHAGLALARCFRWRHHVAWDAYLCYSAGARWDGDTPPEPAEWFHELQDREVWEEQAAAAGAPTAWTEKLAETSEADPARFRTGDDLVVALRGAMEHIVVAAPGA
jgi:hypothetical protein